MSRKPIVIGLNSSFQRERAAREAREARDKDEAAELYASFAASLDADGSSKPVPVQFVHGGVMNAASDSSAAPTAPPRAPPTAAASVKGRTSALAMTDDPPAPPSSAAPPHVDSRKRPREMESFAAELAHRQAAQASAHTGGDDGGSSGSSSNLFVGNLSPAVGEDGLRAAFAPFGEVVSVKVMWPRGGGGASSNNTGFVLFQRRRDAEAAMAGMRDALLEGVRLQVSWARPVKGMPPPAEVEVDYSAMLPPDARVVRVQLPSDAACRAMIDVCAEYVAADGPQLESLLLQHARAVAPDGEVHAGSFAWLFNPSTPEAQYYRWRVWSILNGDASGRGWNRRPFQIHTGGPWFLPPPPQPPARRSASPERRRRRRESRSRSHSPGYRGSDRLHEDDLSTLREKMEALSLERAPVRDFMLFAMQRSQCAADIVEHLVAALQDVTAPAQVLVARLYAAADLAHNSAANVRNASVFRSALHAALPDVFEHLARVYRAIAGRMTSTAMRDRIMRVLTFWERESIFPSVYLTGLEAALMRRMDGATVDPATVDAALVSADVEDLARRCRAAGVSSRGGVEDVRARLAWALHFAAQKHAQSVASAAAAAAALRGRMAATNETSVTVPGPVIEKAVPEHVPVKLDVALLSTTWTEVTAEDDAAAARSRAAAASIAAGEDDDDVDGVPLDAPPVSIASPALAGTKRPAADAAPNIVAIGTVDDDDEDDVDGVPLDLPPRRPAAETDVKRARMMET